MKNSKTFEKILGESAYNRAWDFSDDVIVSTKKLSEIYNDVPPELDVFIHTMELHIFPDDMRKEVLEFLNRGTKK